MFLSLSGAFREGGITEGVVSGISRSDKGLTLETLALNTLYDGLFTLSTQLIMPNYLFHLQPAFCLDCEEDVEFCPRPHVVIQKESVVLVSWKT